MENIIQNPYKERLERLEIFYIESDFEKIFYLVAKVSKIFAEANVKNYAMKEYLIDF